MLDPVRQYALPTPFFPVGVDHPAAPSFLPFSLRRRPMVGELKTLLLSPSLTNPPGDLHSRRSDDSLSSFLLPFPLPPSRCQEGGNFHPFPSHGSSQGSTSNGAIGRMTFSPLFWLDSWQRSLHFSPSFGQPPQDGGLSSFSSSPPHAVSRVASPSLLSPLSSREHAKGCGGRGAFFFGGGGGGVGGGGGFFFGGGGGGGGGVFFFFLCGGGVGVVVFFFFCFGGGGGGRGGFFFFWGGGGGGWVFASLRSTVVLFPLSLERDSLKTGWPSILSSLFFPHGSSPVSDWLQVDPSFLFLSDLCRTRSALVPLSFFSRCLGGCRNRCGPPFSPFFAK